MSRSLRDVKRLGWMILIVPAGCNQASQSSAGGQVGAPSASTGAPGTAPATSGENAGWTVASNVDAMTDRSVQRAITRIVGSGIDADTEVTCNGDRIRYVLTTFDKAGAPAPLMINYGHTRAMLRLDRDAPINLSGLGQVSNRFEFFAVDPKFARATVMTLRLFMVDGEETLQIDQSAGPVRAMLNQCAQSIGSRRQQEQAARDQRAAEEYARCGDHPCPILPPAEPRFTLSTNDDSPDDLDTPPGTSANDR